jgi:hypothetical protein
MTKYWQVLLTKWREQKKNGFTIPYLIGAQNYFSKEGHVYNIETLITDMATARDYETYITYCTDINQLIIGMRSGKKYLGGTFMKLPNGGSSSFFLTATMDLGHNLTDVVASLTERHQYHIESDQFSTNDGDWGGFSEREMKFIQECAGLKR